MRVFVLALFCLSIFGCASSHEIDFRPWSENPQDWDPSGLNGLGFSAPKKLPLVRLNRDLLAFCLTAFKSNGDIIGPYVPVNAVYVDFPLKARSGGNPMEEYLRTIRNNGGWVKHISESNAQYVYWMPLLYSNSEHYGILALGQNADRAINPGSQVVKLAFGYLFYATDGDVGAVYLAKSCNVSLAKISGDDFLTPTERKLLLEILGTMRTGAIK